jgi:hypothetical protein
MAEGLLRDFLGLIGHILCSFGCCIGSSLAGCGGSFTRCGCGFACCLGGFARGVHCFTGGFLCLFHGGGGGFFGLLAGGQSKGGEQCDEKFGLHGISLMSVKKESESNNPLFY